MFSGSAGSIGYEWQCRPTDPIDPILPADPPAGTPTGIIVAACIAAFVLVLGMVVFRRHRMQKSWAYWTPNPMHEHKDTVGGNFPIKLFKRRSDCAVQITRGDSQELSTLVPPCWLIQEKQLRLSKELLGGGSSGIVKKGTFGSCAVAVKHVSLHFLNMEDHLKRRQVSVKPTRNIGQTETPDLRRKKITQRTREK
jgi:hypothetical protein